MRKFIKICAVVLVAVLLSVACMFFGNPVSKILVTRNAKEYVSGKYQGSDYFIESVRYDFKTGSYYADVASPSSADSSFTIYAGINGKISYDTYESAVADKWNTAGRINDEYRNAVDAVFEAEDFPYNQHIAFGDIEFALSDTLEDESVPEYAVSTSSLELDKVYDVAEFGKKAGHLTVYIYDEDVNYERLAEILLGIKVLMDKSSVSFRAIDCVLEAPRQEDGSQTDERRVEVMEFSYSDIRDKGLVNRVKASDEAAKAYYKAMDAEKLS